MGEMKAFIVGVSDYSVSGAPDLPFCKTDLININKALKEGIHIEENSIFKMGMSNRGFVSSNEFNQALELFLSKLQSDDVFLFYFSGHGSAGLIHNLAFSDRLINTQSIIDKIANSKAKSKVIFLDCCYSGNFEINGTKKFKLEDSIESFNGHGYAVLSGSNAYEFSYGDNIGSVFTNVLCSALTNKYLIKKGELSLYDLQLWVKRILEIHTSNDPDHPQHSIFRANVGGTIHFKIYDYQPYIQDEYYYENDDYIISSVEPLHHGMTKKRYVAKVLLKKASSDEEIAKISKEIQKQLMFCDIYKSTRQRERYFGLPSNIIWINFTYTKRNILKGNFYCQTTWVDDNQDKEYWYRTDTPKKRFVDDVYFIFNSSYETISTLISKDNISREEMQLRVRETRSQMITYAQAIISLFDEFQNETISEDELFKKATPYAALLDKLFFESDLPNGDEDLFAWVDANLNLFGTIHDFTLLYNEKYRNTRDSTNRKDVMISKILGYYDELKAIHEFE